MFAPEKKLPDEEIPQIFQAVQSYLDALLDLV